MLAAQPEVGAAHARAPPRRALAEQVGQAQQPVAAGRHLLGLVEQAGVELVGVLALRRRPVGGRGERQRGPAHHRAAVVDRAAEHPVVVGERVAEQPAGRVDGRARDDDAHGAAGAERDGGDVRADRADAEVGQHAVGRADDDRQVGGQPGGARRRRSAGRAARSWSGTTSGSWPSRTPAISQRLGVPPAARRGRSRRWPTRRTGRRTSLRPHSAATSSSLTPPQRGVERHEVGVVLGPPGELHHRRHRVHRRAGARVQAARPPVGDAARRPGRRPGCRPRWRAGPSGVPSLRHRHEPVHGGAQAQPDDAVAALAWPARDDLGRAPARRRS